MKKRFYRMVLKSSTKSKPPTEAEEILTPSIEPKQTTSLEKGVCYECGDATYLTKIACKRCWVVLCSDCQRDNNHFWHDDSTPCDIDGCVGHCPHKQAQDLYGKKTMKRTFKGGTQTWMLIL